MQLDAFQQKDIQSILIKIQISNFIYLKRNLYIDIINFLYKKIMKLIVLIITYTILDFFFRKIPIQLFHNFKLMRSFEVLD